jgi:hypothetical protein
VKIQIEARNVKVNLLSPIDPKEVKAYFSAQAVLLLEKHRS